MDDADTLDGEADAPLLSNYATFEGLGLVVPKSEDDENAVTLEAYVVTNAWGATTGANSGDTVELDFDVDGGFDALGQSSQTTVTHGSAVTLFGNYGGSDIAGNPTALYRYIPTFETDDSNSNCPQDNSLTSGNDVAVYCFTVTSDGPVSLYQITLDATASLIETGTDANYLGEANGWSIANVTNTSSILGYGQWASSSVALTFTAEEEVDGTKTYVVKAPVTCASRSVSASLDINITPETISAHASGVAAASATGNNIWSDQSGTATTDGFDRTDWVSTYRFTDLPTAALNLDE